jgi:hypothetical protein
MGHATLPADGHEADKSASLRVIVHLLRKGTPIPLLGAVKALNLKGLLRGGAAMAGSEML